MEIKWVVMHQCPTGCKGEVVLTADGAFDASALCAGHLLKHARTLIAKKLGVKPDELQKNWEHAIKEARQSRDEERAGVETGSGLPVGHADGPRAHTMDLMNPATVYYCKGRLKPALRGQLHLCPLLADRDEMERRFAEHRVPAL